MTTLPVDQLLLQIQEHLAEVGALVLRAPTGAGKTTRVPQALRQHRTLGRGTIIMLEPRRVAARAAAARMAEEAQTPLGETIGYHVRFDRKVNANTQVVVMTPGIFLQQLQADPFLEHVSTVIFDEFHERGVEVDLAFSLVQLLRQTVRQDLAVLVMSATIDAGPVSRFLGNCPILTSEGRTFPVQIIYRPRRPEQESYHHLRLVLMEASQADDGGILIFLPGLGEIRRVEESVPSDIALSFSVMPLHGDLPLDLQQQALRPTARRKLVLATNVAETSVTVEGISTVLDMGTMRQLSLDEASGLDRLKLVPISRASADQRAGRAGRLGPGRCYRLWDEPGHRARPELDTPEIHRVDLTGPCLRLLALGEDPRHFPWFEAPDLRKTDQALRQLQLLGALDEQQRLTPLGQRMAEIPLQPRLAGLLLRGVELGIGRRAALAAALLSERSPVRDAIDAESRASTSSDLLDLVEAVEEFERSGREMTDLGELDRSGCRTILRVRDQLIKSVPGCASSLADASTEEDRFLHAIYAAYTDRLCQRRRPGEPGGVMLGGRGIRLGKQSTVREAGLFVALDLEGGAQEAHVRSASAVERAWLDQHRMKTEQVITYDSVKDRLQARKVTRFDNLILEDVQSHITDEDQATLVMVQACREHWSKVLPEPESEAGQWITRARCLHAWLPELGLPGFTDEELLQALPEVCSGRRSLKNIRELGWTEFLSKSLSYADRQRLDREVPAALEVPSGSMIPLQYQEGKPPILAVRIQEIFGWTETPRLAQGRVRILLHLLAPNHRPQQITEDLASFWKNGYPQVRKELRGRYPKHSWPDDPLTAEPLRGAKRRKQEES